MELLLATLELSEEVTLLSLHDNPYDDDFDETYDDEVLDNAVPCLEVKILSANRTRC